MARVTVEDCVTKVPNRFELVMLAAQRARDVSSGAALTVDRDDDKVPVIALREIAEGTVDLAELEDSLVKGLQKFVETDEPADDELDLMAIQRDILVEGDHTKPDALANAFASGSDMEIGSAPTGEILFEDAEEAVEKTETS